VKFGEYVTEGVMKVPEKFGFNQSNFGWFGHFRRARGMRSIRFFGETAISGGETLPKELGTCMSIQ
jgi:hypothetical protein